MGTYKLTIKKTELRLQWPYIAKNTFKKNCGFRLKVTNKQTITIATTNPAKGKESDFQRCPIIIIYRMYSFQEKKKTRYAKKQESSGLFTRKKGTDSNCPRGRPGIGLTRQRS